MVSHKQPAPSGSVLTTCLVLLSTLSTLHLSKGQPRSTLGKPSNPPLSLHLTIVIRLFINGEWVDPVEKATIEYVIPSSIPRV
jgi:hypothetical protein